MNNVISRKSTPEELRLFGLFLWVTIELVTDPPEPIQKRFENIVALIDTGASHSSVNKRLAARFATVPIRSTTQFAADREPQNVDVYRCKLFYPIGISAENDFSVLAGLTEPHDVLIGRDLLAKNGAQLIVDFPSGNWSIIFGIAHGEYSA